MRKITKGESADYSGATLQIGRFRLFTQPMQSNIEIYIGAMGESNLALAGKICEGAIVVLYPMSKLAECLQKVNRDAGGRKRTVFAYLPLRVTSSEKEERIAREQLSKYIAFYVSSMGKYYVRNLSKLGFQNEAEKIIEAHTVSSKDSASAVTEDFLEQFCLIGSPRKVLERIASIPEGIHPVFALGASTPQDGTESARSLRELSVALGPTNK